MYKRIPKAQRGVAKIAKSLKTAKKISNVAKKGAPAIVRKAKGVKSAQKSLSQAGLTGTTASQLRSQFNELLKQASALSKKKASTKKLALKQKGGMVKTPKRKNATMSKFIPGGGTKVGPTKPVPKHLRGSKSAADFKRAPLTKKVSKKIKRQLSKVRPVKKARKRG